MNTRFRFLRVSRPVAALSILLAGLLLLLTHRLGLGPGWGWGGAGPRPNTVPLAGSVDPLSPQSASSNKQPDASPGPLQITIDDARYLVGDLPVDSVDALVKLAVAVPKTVPPPRVLVVLRPTARYVAEKNLTDALQAASVDFRVEK